VCKALLRGCSSRPELREQIVCVTRLMDMQASSLLARHFSVRSCDISDVIIIGDLHPQQQQLVINTDQVCRPKQSTNKPKTQVIVRHGCIEHFPSGQFPLYRDISPVHLTIFASTCRPLRTFLPNTALSRSASQMTGGHNKMGKAGHIAKKTCSQYSIHRPNWEFIFKIL